MKECSTTAVQLHALCIAVLAVATEAVPTRPLRGGPAGAAWGVQWDGRWSPQNESAAPLPGVAPLMWASGAGWARLVVSWAAVETVEGVYNWSAADAWVRGATAADKMQLRGCGGDPTAARASVSGCGGRRSGGGLAMAGHGRARSRSVRSDVVARRFVISLLTSQAGTAVHPQPVANPLYDNGDSPHSARAVAAYARFGAAAARHFGGLDGVHEGSCVELDNEPDVNWQHGGVHDETPAGAARDGAQYGRMAAAAAAAIRAVAASERVGCVLAGALTAWRCAPGGGHLGPAGGNCAFANATMRAEGGALINASVVDGFTLHPYGVPTRGLAAYCAFWRRLMAANAAAEAFASGGGVGDGAGRVGIGGGAALPPPPRRMMEGGSGRRGNSFWRFKHRGVDEATVHTQSAYQDAFTALDDGLPDVVCGEVGFKTTDREGATDDDEGAAVASLLLAGAVSSVPLTVVYELPDRAPPSPRCQGCATCYMGLVQLPYNATAARLGEPPMRRKPSFFAARAYSDVLGASVFSGLRAGPYDAGGNATVVVSVFVPTNRSGDGGGRSVDDSDGWRRDHRAAMPPTLAPPTLSPPLPLPPPLPPLAQGDVWALEPAVNGAAPGAGATLVLQRRPGPPDCYAVTDHLGARTRACVAKNGALRIGPLSAAPATVVYLEADASGGVWASGSG